MTPLDAILERVSAPQLTGPDITTEQLNTLIQAALRAPDHAWLRPSRYIAVRGDARESLGQVFLSATPDSDKLSAEKQNKIRNMPLRAPLLLVAVTKVVEHAKVPRDEQILSTGAGVQNILNAAWALGLGAIWRTGDLAYNPDVATALRLDADETIVGFIYVGHVNCRLKQPPQLETSEYLTDWMLKAE